MVQCSRRRRTWVLSVVALCARRRRAWVLSVVALRSRRRRTWLAIPKLARASGTLPTPPGIP